MDEECLKTGDRESYDSYLSSALVSGDVISGILVTTLSSHVLNERTLELKLFKTTPKTTPLEICAMLSQTMKRAFDLYGSSLMIRAISNNPVFIKILRYPIPDCPVNESKQGVRRL